MLSLAITVLTLWSNESTLISFAYNHEGICIYGKDQYKHCSFWRQGICGYCTLFWKRLCLSVKYNQVALVLFSCEYEGLRMVLLVLACPVCSLL